MKTKYQNTSIDEAIPELAPEIIAGDVTPDRQAQGSLCARLRLHWSQNQGFRNSFKRKDPREVCLMWMDHWQTAASIRASRTNMNTLPDEASEFWSKWQPASGKQGKKGELWRLTKGYSPMQVLEGRSGTPVYFHSYKAAQRHADKLNNAT